MRIAIFTDNFYPELSGVADSIITTVKELGVRGHEVMIFAPKYSKKNFSVINKNNVEIDLGKNVKITRMFSCPVPFVSTKQARLVILGSGYFRIKKFKPEIIHSQHYFGAGLNALLFSRLLKIPLIGTNHTLIEAIAKHFSLVGKLFGKILSKYEIWYYNHCWLLTTPCDFLFNLMKARGLTVLGKTISNPVDDSIFKNFRENRDSLRIKYNLSGFILVYAGRLAKEKKVDVLIRALQLIIKIIPDVNLLLCGHGSEEKSLIKLANELGITDRVKFLGSVSHSVLAEYYNAADLFVIASTSEIQSMTVIQSLACGLPVVAASSGGLTELGEKSRNLLFEADNENDLAKKIVFASESNNLVELRKNGLEYTKGLVPKIISEEWEGIYKRVINDYTKVDNK